MTDSPALAFGEELRRERQIREISLEEISSATKISVRLLTALEEGNLERLPAPAFTRGFIRAYALHIGIAPEEMVNAYLADLAGGPREAAGPKKARPRSRFFRGRRGSASLMVGAVAAVLLVLGFIGSPQRHDRSGAATVVAPRAVPVAFKNVDVSNEPTPFIQNRMDAAGRNPAAAAAAGAMEPVALSTPAEAAHGIALTLEFADDSWAKVDADGRTVLNGMVHRGETRRLQAQQGFRLTLGNAGGVRVSVDGRALEPLGATGEVVRDLPLPAAPTRG
ncbi:MAG: RodZ domain-containing protein [Acidobacteriota bacterium]